MARHPNRPHNWFAVLFGTARPAPAAFRPPSLPEAVAAEIDSIGWAGRRPSACPDPTRPD
jgi:hypothetical protein